MIAKSKVFLLQKNLVSMLKKRGLIKSKKVEKAFLSVTRHLFLPGVNFKKVYSDEAIVTKWGDRKNKIPLSSSTQPAAMAIMLEQLELRKDLKVLEIGAGTGFNAALMAYIVGKKGQIVTLDIDKNLCISAERNLNSGGFSNVKVICKDGFYGYKTIGPYDRIILTVSFWDIAPEWFEQLKIGGILLLPLINKFDQMTIAFKKKKDHLESVSVSGCKFMSFRGKHYRELNTFDLGDKKEILLTTNYKSKLKDKEIYYLLNKSSKDYSTDIKVSTREIGTGLNPWLGINESKYCVLSTTPKYSKRINLRTIFNYDGRNYPKSPGLIDNESVCVLVRSPNDVSLPKPKKNEPELMQLYVRNFGKNENLAKHLVDRIEEWDKAGRPNINNLKVKAYFNKRTKKPNDKEGTISKKWVKLLYSWNN
jgi:protein-L-isoaspartate(D-aspartate) O-methyltransferase